MHTFLYQIYLACTLFCIKYTWHAHFSVSNVTDNLTRNEDLSLLQHNAKLVSDRGVYTLSTCPTASYFLKFVASTEHTYNTT